MSTWRIAVDAAGLDQVTKRSRAESREPAAAGAPIPGTNDKIENDVLARITKWIPGDTLALYATAVTSTGSKPSVALLVGAAVFAALSVVLIAFSKSPSIDWRRVSVSALLAVVGFAIWSAAVPQNGWHAFDFVEKQPALIAVGATAAGSLFCLFAEGIMSRISP